MFHYIRTFNSSFWRKKILPSAVKKLNLLSTLHIGSLKQFNTLRQTIDFVQLVVPPKTTFSDKSEIADQATLMISTTNKTNLF
jgi:hypothetical protein